MVLPARTIFQTGVDCNTTPCITNVGKEKHELPARLVNVYEKGEEKGKKDFGRKIFNNFHVISKSTQLGDTVDEQSLNDIDE